MGIRDVITWLRDSDFKGSSLTGKLNVRNYIEPLVVFGIFAGYWSDLSILLGVDECPYGFGFGRARPGLMWLLLSWLPAVFRSAPYQRIWMALSRSRKLREPGSGVVSASAWE